MLAPQVAAISGQSPAGSACGLRAPAGDHTALGEAVQPGLHGAAGHAQPARGLEHSHPRLRGEEREDRGVDPVDRGLGHCDHSLPCALDDLTTGALFTVVAQNRL